MKKKKKKKKNSYLLLGHFVYIKFAVWAQVIGRLSGYWTFIYYYDQASRDLRLSFFLTPSVPGQSPLGLSSKECAIESTELHPSCLQKKKIGIIIICCKYYYYSITKYSGIIHYYIHEVEPKKKKGTVSFSIVTTFLKMQLSRKTINKK